MVTTPTTAATSASGVLAVRRAMRSVGRLGGGCCGARSGIGGGVGTGVSRGGCGWMRAASGEQGVLRRRLGMLLVVLLLQEKVGTRREEGVWRLLRRDRRDGMTILGAEATQHVQDLARLTNRLADVAEGISKLLQAAGVLSDIHVTLHQISKLRLQIDSTMELVVAELLMDGSPDAVGSCLGRTNDVTNILGDGDVQPAQDALVT